MQEDESVSRRKLCREEMDPKALECRRVVDRLVRKEDVGDLRA